MIVFSGDTKFESIIAIESRCLRCNQIVHHFIETIVGKNQTNYDEDKYITFKFADTPKHETSFFLESNKESEKIKQIEQPRQLNLADMECTQHMPLQNTMTFYCNKVII